MHGLFLVGTLPAISTVGALLLGRLLAVDALGAVLIQLLVLVLDLLLTLLCLASTTGAGTPR